MTYQEAFYLDRYAQTATMIGHQHKKSAEWMQDTAFYLHFRNAERIKTKGKPMSDDHLKQEAVKRG